MDRPCGRAAPRCEIEHSLLVAARRKMSVPHPEGRIPEPAANGHAPCTCVATMEQIVAGRWAGALLDACVLGGTWLLLAGRVSAPEILAGAAAGVASLGLAARCRKGEGRLTWPGRPAVAALSRLLWRVLVETAVVARFAWRRAARGRRLRGGYRSIRYRDADPVPSAAARRAVGTVVGSFAPNGYVVTAEPRRRLLVHRLVGWRRRPRGRHEDWPL